MTPLFLLLNSSCIENFGFDSSIFPIVESDSFLKERVLNDILDSEFTEVEKGGIASRAFYKYRRWKANRWKHELCFNDSLLSAFWSGIKSHLLKPSSI